MTVQGDAVSFVRRRPWALAVAILVAVPFLTTVVEAAIPDAAGDIHACYEIYNGEIRIIDSGVGATCAAAERELTWSAGRFRTGTGVPPDTLGRNGDMFFDTTNKVLYGPKTGGAWPTTGTGLPGVSGWQILESSAFTVTAGAYNNTLSLSCTGGKKAVGGGIFTGGFLSDPAPQVVIESSAPTQNGLGWYGAVKNEDTNSHVVYVRVICANV